MASLRGPILAVAAMSVIVPMALWLRAPPVDPITVREPLPARTIPPEPVAAFARPLFAPPVEGAGHAPSDAPVLLGIAGRLDRDAVALVRGEDGATRTLAPGASIDGWTLETLAVDAAYFTRGGQRARVAVPDG